MTEGWRATLVLTTSPDELLADPVWATAKAACIPAGGNGFNLVCRALAQEGPCEEPTVVAAFDLPGSMVQQLLEAFRCAG
eukprot:10116881-Lingulodinium_polyedra.AAC.1